MLCNTTRAVATEAFLRAGSSSSECRRDTWRTAAGVCAWESDSQLAWTRYVTCLHCALSANATMLQHHTHRVVAVARMAAAACSARLREGCELSVFLRAVCAVVHCGACRQKPIGRVLLHCLLALDSCYFVARTCAVLRVRVRHTYSWVCVLFPARGLQLACSNAMQRLDSCARHELVSVFRVQQGFLPKVS